MDQSLKKEWLDALKSNKYKKGKGTLKCDDKYCCLGVLADILYKKEEYKEFKIIDDDSTMYIYDKYNSSGCYLTDLLPEIILEKIQMSNNIQKYLVRLNDNTETFKEVIERIEKIL